MGEVPLYAPSSSVILHVKRPDGAVRVIDLLTLHSFSLDIHQVTRNPPRHSGDYESFKTPHILGVTLAPEKASLCLIEPTPATPRSHTPPSHHLTPRAVSYTPHPPARTRNILVGWAFSYGRGTPALHAGSSRRRRPRPSHASHTALSERARSASPLPPPLPPSPWCAPRPGTT